MISDWSVILLSLRVSLVATAIVVPVGLAVAWLLVRKRMPGLFLVDLLVSLPLAVTPVVIGYALLFVFGQSSPVGRFMENTIGVSVAFTWLGAVLASAILAFPLAVRAFMVALSGVDTRLEAAARSLGARPARVFATITLPLAYRGIVAGTLLAFVRALSEFGATIMIAGNIPGQTQTIPLAIFARISAGRDGAALQLVVVAIVIAAVSILIHNYLVGRVRTTESTAEERGLR